MIAKHWDAIVLGAGIGGLSAAARLVKAGLQVLVLEKSSHPGGTAYAYTRGGFTFPMGPLGFSTPGLVRDTWTALGHAKHLHFRRVHYQIIAFDVRISLSLPFDRMTEEMTRWFPADSRGVKEFFRDIDKLLSAMRFFNRKTDCSLLETVANIPASEYLHGLITDWRLCRILGSLGTREAYTGLPLLAAMWDLMCNQGIWYPEGGMHSLCHRLANIVTGEGERDRGCGEIRFGAEVKEIRVRHGRVSGVSLVGGSKIDAAAVISNADYKTTFMKLVKPEHIPGPWHRAVAKAKQSSSIFQVCLGVDANRLDMSIFSDASRLIYRRSRSMGDHGHEKLDWLDAEVNPQALAEQELEVSLWSREDSRLAPDGAAVIVIRTEANHAHFARHRPVEGQRSAGYPGYKTRLGQALVRESANLIPGLEGAVLVMDVATPLTFEERGGRSQGAVAGWSWDYEDNPGYRPLDLIQTPIRGLYMAGYQAYSALFMGGVPTAIASGYKAAEALLQGAGPANEIRIPGTWESGKPPPFRTSTEKLLH